MNDNRYIKEKESTFFALINEDNNKTYVGYAALPNKVSYKIKKLQENVYFTKHFSKDSYKYSELETINTTQSHALSHRLLWIRVFMENGYYVVNSSNDIRMSIAAS